MEGGGALASLQGGGGGGGGAIPAAGSGGALRVRSALSRSVAVTAARSAGEGEGQALLREPRGQTRLLLDGGGGDGTGAALGTLLEAALTGLAGGLGGAE